MEKASTGDTLSYDHERISSGQYDFSRNNDPFSRVHSSFVPEDVPDAVSEKDLVWTIIFAIFSCSGMGRGTRGWELIF